MATGIAALTELDAVNTMLGGVYELPVNQLDGAGLSDVAVARRVLSDTVRSLLLKGTANNVESDVQLLPDNVSGKVPLPANVLRVDSMASDGRDVVQRGSFLYDRTNHTFIFDSAVSVEIYYHLEWVDLPEHIKYPAMILAARRFQAQVLGSADKGAIDAQAEADARVILGMADADNEDSNYYTDSWSVTSILQR